MAQIERLATTPRGADPVVDKILDHTISGCLVSINPDGRVAGTRANANGFDMNRDYLIQSQPEMQVSTRVMREWNAPIFVDLHGYYTPAMIGGPTKPHSEAVENDLFLNWNQLAAGQDRGRVRRRAATGCSGRSTTGARAGRCRARTGAARTARCRAGRGRGPG